MKFLLLSRKAAALMILLVIGVGAGRAGEKMTIPARPHPEGDILKFQARNTKTEKGRRNVYYSFSEEEFEIMVGDFLEFDVYVKEESPDIVGTVELEFANGGLFRGTGILDQSGVSGHPGVPLGNLARGKWYHRAFNLEKLVGWTVKEWQIALATNANKEGVYTVYFDNVRIANNGKTVKKIYSEGKPKLSSLKQSQMLEDVSLSHVKLDEEGYML